MKKTLILGMALGVVSMTASLAFAGASPDRGEVDPADITKAYQKNWGGQGIVGSSHDLSYDATYTGLNGGHTEGASPVVAYIGATNQDVQKRICIFCHHPHNSIAAGTATNSGDMDYSPLWNRNMSEVVFTAYTNGFANGEVVNATSTDKRHDLNAGSNVIGPVSLLCMSCHDGVVALSAYSQQTGSFVSGSVQGGNSSANNPLTGTAAFAGNLSNHHPMGFNYVAVQGADAEIADVATPLVPDGTVRIQDVLYGGNMECVTCHDVHNTANQAGAERFLWRTNDHSNFCLTCHLK